MPPTNIRRSAARLFAVLRILTVSLVFQTGCAYLPHATVYWGGLEVQNYEETKASWISPDLKGQKGAFGEPHNPDTLVASHPAIPYGTFVRVTNLDNGRGTIVRISDKARQTGEKRLFVSHKAAEQLDMIDSGVANVRIEPIEAQVGVATWYGSLFHGRRTSSGEIYDQEALTAAHRFLPFGTIVRVVNLETNQSVLVRVNDRGSFIKGRVIDLSRRAGEEIGIAHAGKALVRVEIVRPPAPNGRES